VNNFKYLSVFSVSRFKFETGISWINSLNINHSTVLSVEFWKCVRPFVLYYSTGRVEVLKRAVYKKLLHIKHVTAISTFRAKYVNIRNTLEWFPITHDFRFLQKVKVSYGPTSCCYYYLKESFNRMCLLQ
jgi:hypothetical protein